MLLHVTTKGKPLSGSYAAKAARCFQLFFFLAAAMLTLPAQAQKTFSFYFNGTTYSYIGSYANSPDNNYATYMASHPTSNSFATGPGDGHYNCHAYAWANDKTVWVQTGSLTNSPPQIYYNSGYYVQTLNESEAELAVYGQPSYPIHTALRITNSSNAFGAQALTNYPQYAGWYISKWDGGPLVVHRLTDCPYAIANVPITFYRKSTTALTANYIQGSNFAISGPRMVCSSGTQFTLTCGTPVSFTVTWSSSSNITLPANPTACPITVTANGTGNGWVKATANFPDGTSSVIGQKTVWVGNPEPITSVSTSQFTPGQGTTPTIIVDGPTGSLYAHPYNGGDVLSPFGMDTHGATYYTWTFSGGITFNQNPATLGYRHVGGYLTPPGFLGMLSVNASNDCGSSYYWQSVRVSGGSFRMSPNPASNELTITMEEESPAATKQTTAKTKPVAKVNTAITYDIRITDVSGVICGTLKRSGTKFSIPVRQLKNGMYIVEVSDGKTVYTKSIVVAH
ncbi:Por secretion system C-terminal sorting domain-containing protein [Chitinophaga arvensicola]|uniref:Por secretion system C-terminal sorting domain-containing protein n=2 Tax=Chitinophaga arvensicola TaxID=29529 RepID=A0A1I0S4W0_9BACT|nr:Por secretion system C-terminal sorting domain-containing protein [Chitinophaga arvensicola]